VAFRKGQSTSSKSYTVYHIVAKSLINEWTVSYRFSEMKNFHDKICKNYRKINVDLPKFPNKTIFSNRESVIKDRKIQLADYLNCMIERVNILDDEDICEFLQISNQLRSFLSDLQMQKSKKETISCPKRRPTEKMEPSHLLKKSMGNNDEQEFYDFVSLKSLKENRERIMKKEEHLKQMQEKLESEISLYNLYKTYGLTEEEIVKRFFSSMILKPQNRDILIK